MERQIDRAIGREEEALRLIDGDNKKGADTALEQSRQDLHEADGPLGDRHGVVGSVILAVGDARTNDARAMTNLAHGAFTAAAKEVEEGLTHKALALHDLSTAATPSPTTPPPPTISVLQDCSFNPSAGQLEVKVSWQGEGGATVHVAVGPSSNQLTTTLNASGVGYVGPFTIQAGTTYPIFIQASNPTTGKTAQATATGFQGSNTATDCQVQGG